MPEKLKKVKKKSKKSCKIMQNAELRFKRKNPINFYKIMKFS